MSPLIQRTLQKTALTLISAVLFVGFFKFNDWIFHTLEHSKGVNWVFLPAGFRVILVLVLGLPGALGLMLVLALKASALHGLMGRALVQAAGRALAALLTEIDRLPADTLR